MKSNIRKKAILKVVGITIFAALFCIGCSDNSTGGDTDTTYYTITFDPTGGTVTPTSGTVAATGRNKIGLLMSAPTPTKNGYTFIGWYTRDDDHGHAVTAGWGASEAATFSKDDTIYARWTLAHYRITFDAHGGTVTPAFDTTGDDWKLASLPMPTRDNHTFDGWYVDIVGVREKVTGSKVYSENTTLYAHWIYTGDHYTITFDPNGGAVDPETEETDVGGILQDLPTPERDGYAFIGWFTEKTGGTAVTTNTVFKEAAIVYARWTEITDKMYKVTFNAHGGTVTPAFGMTGEDGKLLAPLPTPKRDGYAFQGWFTEVSVVTASTVFSANATIHAQWAIIHYTITFNAVGGTVTPTTATTGAHWELAELPTPIRNHYTFRGWYTAETGGTLVTTSMALMGNLTIYAHWRSHDTRYTITFDANGGEVSPETDTTGNNWKLTSLPTPTRDGYAFHGWFTDKTGDTHVTTFTVFEENTTVYAQWVAVVYGESVTYGGETYQTEVIGTQTWFARNLNYAVEGSRCYGEGGNVHIQTIHGSTIGGGVVKLSDAEVQANCEKYGRLYDWSAAMSACPTGWHLPSDAEWTTLTDYVGGSEVAGWELRSPSSYWGYNDDNEASTIVGADDYGFSALPGGRGDIHPIGGLLFFSEGSQGTWWSATEKKYDNEPDRAAYVRRMDYWREDITRETDWVYRLYSVRCVKD